MLRTGTEEATVSEREAVTFRRLNRAEAPVMAEWAAREGWNPGLHDVEAFWAQDPDGFWGAEVDDELVGCASAVAYDGAFGFWGFFIVRPERRGRGIGAALAPHTIGELRGRLRPGAAIGLDGVFAQQDYYASLGFVLSHRNLRMQGTGRAGGGGSVEHRLVPQAGVDPAALAAHDAEHFGVARPRFLDRWSRPEDGVALAAVDGDDVIGAGAVRRCRMGWKVGPLFARDADVARSLLAALSARAEGEPLFLDVPEINADALALADEHGMSEVFGCARMYLGDPPPTPWDRVFGVTTFELG